MANFIKTQKSFAHGAVSPEFYLRDDINGLSHLENMDVMAGGGLTRRAGLVNVADLSMNVRLIAFSAGGDENYLLAMGGGHMYIYRGATRIRDILIPWSDDDLPQIQYAQRFGTMIFVHPNYRPRVLQKTGALWTLDNFAFAYNASDLSVKMPFMRFDDADGIIITLSTSNLGNNYATLTTNEDFWTSDNVGGLLYMIGRQWTIHSFQDARTVVAFANNGYTMPSSPVSDWQEAAFGTRRGWPCSITFHQNRLVFGGTPSWPSGIWMSHVGVHNNFDVGTGLDDEAIFITLMSSVRQQISTVVSGDNLQILTNVGEWAISNKPLTPASVDVKQHTSVGSMTTRYLPPQKIEGATVFVSASGADIRELDMDTLGENYNATDLCMFAKHLMHSPIDIAYNDDEHRLYVVMADGTMAVLNQNSAVGISAWCEYTTGGAFTAVAVLNGETYVCVNRDDNYSIEKFDATSLADAGDNKFALVARAMPLRVSGHNAKKLRSRKITARVVNTKSLFINGVRVTLPNVVQDDASTGYTGDVSINSVGTIDNNTTTPMWTIHTDEIKPITIMSVTIYGFYTI